MTIAIGLLTIGVALGILAMVGVNFELDSTHYLPADSAAADTIAAIHTSKAIPDKPIGAAKREDKNDEQ